MFNLKKLTIHHKLVLGFATMAILLLVNMLVFTFSMQSFYDSIAVEKVFRGFIPSVKDLIIEKNQFVFTKDRQSSERVLSGIDQIKDIVSKELNVASNRQKVSSSLNEIKANLDSFYTSFNEYMVLEDQKSALENNFKETSVKLINEVSMVNDAVSGASVKTDDYKAILKQVNRIEVMVLENRLNTLTDPEDLQMTLNAIIQDGQDMMAIMAKYDAGIYGFRIVTLTKEYKENLNKYYNYKVLQDSKENVMNHLAKQIESTCIKASETISLAVQQDLNDLRIRLMIVVLISLSLGLLMVSTLSSNINKRMKQLIHANEMISKGEYDIALQSSSNHDEIDTLAESTLQMAKDLQQSEFKLLEANRHLEDLVKERTADLLNTIDALAFSEEKYSKAFKHISEIVGLTKVSDQKYLEVNDAFFKSLGYSREIVLGHASSDFGLWHDSEKRKEFFEILSRDHTIKNFETDWVSDKGEVRTGLQSAEITTIAGEEYEIFIWNDITDRKRAEEALQKAHDQLELKVEERTSELTALNEELIALNAEMTNALDTIRKTQAQLVHSEKMAALSGLVAGMSHEISTPIGIAVTSISYIEKELNEIRKRFDEGSLKKSTLEEFISEATTLSKTISRNLERSDLLIKSFKQISVDQVNEDIRKFHAKPYLEELLVSLHPLLKKKPHKIMIECPDDLEIKTYPGAIAQIITNFITNSLRHGFEEGFIGTITLTMSRHGDDTKLIYSDDGVGMSPDILSQIYDPFFTTKRGSAGGTGLGMNLVFNIVTQKLGGEISCQSEEGKGVRFEIIFPDLSL